MGVKDWGGPWESLENVSHCWDSLHGLLAMQLEMFHTQCGQEPDVFAKDLVLSCHHAEMEEAMTENHCGQEVQAAMTEQFWSPAPAAAALVVGEACTSRLHTLPYAPDLLFGSNLWTMQLVAAEVR